MLDLWEVERRGDYWVEEIETRYGVREDNAPTFNAYAGIGHEVDQEGERTGHFVAWAGDNAHGEVDIVEAADLDAYLLGWADNWVSIFVHEHVLSEAAIAGLPFLAAKRAADRLDVAALRELAPEGAVAFRVETPREPAGWVSGEAMAEVLEKEDPSLIIWLDPEREERRILEAAKAAAADLDYAELERLAPKYGTKAFVSGPTAGPARWIMSREEVDALLNTDVEGEVYLMAAYTGWDA